MNLPKEYYDKSLRAKIEWLQVEAKKAFAHANDLYDELLDRMNEEQKRKDYEGEAYN